MPSKTFAGQYTSLAAIADFIAQAAQEVGLNSKDTYAVKLAVDEACTNIIQHGYKGMDPGSIILSFRIEPERILVQITDFGHVFEPADAPEPDVVAALEDRELGGLGLYLIYQTMDNIDYVASEEGNTLTFTKLLS